MSLKTTHTTFVTLGENYLRRWTVLPATLFTLLQTATGTCAREWPVDSGMSNQRCCKRDGAIRIGVVVLAALLSFSASADVGVPALRILCSTNSDKIELEPFIAWNEGNSPYPEFGAEQATAQSVMIEGENQFYSFGTDGHEFIYAICKTRSRTVRVFVTNQQEITVTEHGSAVIDALPAGDTWDNWEAIYLLRSAKPERWDECFGRQSEGYENLRCVRFDPAKPNNRFLSKPQESEGQV